MEIVRIIITSLIIVCSSWVIGLIFARLRFSACEDKDIKILRPPKFIFWLGIGGIVGIYTIIIIIFTVAFTPENVAYSIGFFLISILFFWFILYSLNWKVELKENTFIFQNSFRLSKEYSYKDITKVKRIEIGGFRVYVGKKSIAVDFYIKGANNFLEKIKYM